MSRIKYYDSTTQTWKYSDLAVQNPLPVGTNNGDILVWDATEQEWVSAPPWRSLYVPLSFIQSTGTQYIDTGITVTSGLKVVDNSQFNATSAVINGVIRNATNPKMSFTWGASDTTVFKSLIGTSSGSWASTSIPLDTNPHTWELESGSQKFDGVQYGTQTIVERDVPVYLFAWNGEGQVVYTAGETRTNTKIYVNNVLVADFIPVLSLQTNKVGMLNKVTMIFHGNKGTGDFIGGNPV